jgi:hypothetical protein
MMDELNVKATTPTQTYERISDPKMAHQLVTLPVHSYVV